MHITAKLGLESMMMSVAPGDKVADLKMQVRRQYGAKKGFVMRLDGADVLLDEEADLATVGIGADSVVEVEPVDLPTVFAAGGVPHQLKIHSCVMNDSGTLIATGSDDKTICISNSSTLATLCTIKAAMAVFCCAFSPCSKFICLGGATEKVYVFDTVRNKKVRSMKGHTSRVYGCVYSTDGKYLATASCDRTAIVWNARTGDKLAVLGGSSSLYCCAFDPTGEYLAVAGNKVLTVYDWRTKTVISTHECNVTVWSVAFSPCGQYIASSSSAGTVSMLFVGTNAAEVSRRSWKIQAHSQPAHKVIFAAEGRALISCGRDQHTRIWDSQTAALIEDLPLDTSPVTAIAAVDDRLVTCAGPALKMWTLSPTLLDE